MKKSIPIVILVAICMTGSIACHKEETPVSESSYDSSSVLVSISESGAEQETISSVSIDDEYAWQLQVISDYSGIWKRSDEDDLEDDWYCMYSIMDLDRDGLLEVCKCAQFDNGPVTEFWIFEVTSDGYLVELESELGTDICPDLLYEQDWNFYGENGVYRYLLSDCVSYGIGGVFYHYGYLSIRDDRIVFDTVCTYSRQASDEGDIEIFYDGEGNEIGDEEFKEMLDENTNEDCIHLEWFGEGETDSEHIKSSFNVFFEK